MATKKQDEIVSEASPHTIKKFELIEKYVEEWAPKLLNNAYCNKLVFIDCMCNSGEYTDKNGNKIFGTPIRVARVLAGFAKLYPEKEIVLYFNDYSKEKIEHLANYLTMKQPNLHINLSVKDGNALLTELAPTIIKQNTAYLLVYDPYDASIDWGAISPYINNWGEVIINHMLYDSTRAVKMVKSEQAKKKYEATYLADIEELVSFGSDRTAYENRIEEIISELHINKKGYIASFPFFNSRNSIVYNLIHCTNNSAGFKLYKKVAWKTFGGKSSTLQTHGSEQQLTLDFDDDYKIKTTTIDGCYYIKDIAEYLQKKYRGRKDIELTEIWDVLDNHPIFPSDGFKNEIKKELKENYGAVLSRTTINFSS